MLGSRIKYLVPSQIYSTLTITLQLNNTLFKTKLFNQTLQPYKASFDTLVIAIYSTSIADVATVD